MNRTVALLALLAAVCRPAHADLTHGWEYDNYTDSDGLVGLHISRASIDPFAHGISWDIDGMFMWHSGLDITLDYSYPGVSPTPPDLVLAYSSLTHADNLRMRADDARMVLGPRIGHPTLPFQLDIETDSRNSGLALGTNNYQYSAYFYNHGSPANNRTSLNLAGLWSWGTDLGQNGGDDLWLWNFKTQAPMLQFSASQGGMGFFGASPTSKPAVTGSWSDGSAQKSMLAALVKLGLVSDQTTP
jgi:hypothetical protein